MEAISRGFQAIRYLYGPDNLRQGRGVALKAGRYSCGQGRASDLQRNNTMRNELLAIDDADLHLSIISKIAAQADFTTTGANSVIEATRLLRERTFDCITLDLSLGEESGIEILKLLAQMKCRTPIIIISGLGHAASEATVEVGNFLKLNLCPPIPKPIHLVVLRAALAEIAHGSQQQKLAMPVSG
jgi:two-component system chemotaxis response regulator CheY